MSEENNSKKSLLESYMRDDWIPTNPEHSIKKGRILYLFLHVMDENTDLINERMNTILDVLMNHKGVVWSVNCSVVMVSFGFPHNSYEEGLHLCSLAMDELSKQLGTAIRIVYGVAEGVLDFVGCSRLQSYGPIFPLFGQKLGHLFSLDAGAIEEF
jgi:hypothetical protein